MKSYLIDVVKEIIALQERFNKEFGSSPFNQSVDLVKVFDNGLLYSCVAAYRDFLQQRVLEIQTTIEQIQTYVGDASVVYRIKNQNSVESKIERYINDKPEHGKIGVNKCLNDLLGFRVTGSDCLGIDVIKQMLQKIAWRVTSADNHGYIANHIYVKVDNFHFVWEIQLWQNKNERNNLACHKQYKQGYTTWEKDNGEEVVTND